MPLHDEAALAEIIAYGTHEHFNAVIARISQEKQVAGAVQGFFTKTVAALRKATMERNQFGTPLPAHVQEYFHDAVMLYTVDYLRSTGMATEELREYEAATAVSANTDNPYSAMCMRLLKQRRRVRRTPSAAPSSTSSSPVRHPSPAASVVSQTARRRRRRNRRPQKKEDTDPPRQQHHHARKLSTPDCTPGTETMTESDRPSSYAAAVRGFGKKPAPPVPGSVQCEPQRPVASPCDGPRGSNTPEAPVSIRHKPAQHVNGSPPKVNAAAEKPSAGFSAPHRSRSVTPDPQHQKIGNSAKKKNAASSLRDGHHGSKTEKSPASVRNGPAKGAVSSTSNAPRKKAHMDAAGAENGKAKKAKKVRKSRAMTPNRRHAPKTRFVTDPELLLQRLSLHATARPTARVDALIDAAEAAGVEIHKISHARSLAKRLSSVESYGLDLDERVSDQKSCRVSPATVEKLVKTKLFTPLARFREETGTTTPVLRRCGLNFVAEEEKQRLRVIIWPRQLNAEHDRGRASPIGDSVLSAAQVKPGTYARASDIREAFHHLKLTGDVPLLYVMSLNGVDHVFRAACMGANWSADLCHLLVELLARMAVRDTAVKYFVHVDNVRFVAPHAAAAAVDATHSRFMELAQQYGLTCRDDDALSFCGMQCDYSAGRVSLTEKFKGKLKASLSSALAPAACYRDVLTAWGRLMAAARILRVRQYDYFPLWKFMRRRAAAFASGRLELHSPCPVWDCTKTLWRVYHTDVLNAAKRGATHVGDPLSNDKWALYVDASTTGWGGVLFDGETNAVHETGGSWKCAHASGDMSFLEAQALAEAAVAFSPRFRKAKAGTLLVLSDSTAAQGALRKTQSASFQLNSAVGKAFRGLEALAGWKVLIAHVPTAQNLADLASRGDSIFSGSVAATRVVRALRKEHHAEDVESALTRVVGERLPSATTLQVPAGKYPKREIL